MNKTISILGCGWLGYPLARYWQEKGYTIKGSSRSEEKLALLEKESIQSFHLDIEDQSEVQIWRSFLKAEILIVAIPDKNIDAHRQLAKMITCSSLQQIIYTSSTSVYAPAKFPVNENDKLNEENSLMAIENIYQDTNIPACVLRLSGLVGPDRHPGRFFRRRPDATLAKVPVNLIHLDDVIQVMDWIIDHLPCREIFNVTSVEHPTKFDFYSKAYEVYYKKPAAFQYAEDDAAYKLINADKLKKMSGLSFSLAKHYAELF